MKDNMVDLIVTSPPYFVNMEYEEIKKDKNIKKNWKKYVYDFLLPIFKESKRVLKPGGHLWINIDDSHTSVKSELGKNIVLPTHAVLITELSKIFDYKEKVLWKKIRGKHSSGGSNRMLGSYGRFGSPGSIPIVQEVEYILWFKKEGKRDDITDQMRKKSSLTSEEFKRYGMQIWDVKPQKNNRDRHPAPFPIEIPKRIIKLGSFQGDLILDPFLGSGTTAIAAKMLNRNWIGFDKEKKYINYSYERLAQKFNKKYIKEIPEEDRPLQKQLF
jgi:site-specific DNA-methyltransferase (adenine-specific)